MQVVVDATLWLGWHAVMMISHMSIGSTFIGIDRDSDNLAMAQSYLADSANEVQRYLVHRSFADIDQILDSQTIDHIDFVLYDLGVSSAHYDDGDRWFSVRSDAPLDMRFDRTRGRTAADLIAELSEEQLREIFYRYADEKKSPFIARAIIESRKNKPILTTFDLVEIIRGSSYDPHSPKRVFQALRIAVNDEFVHVETSIKKAINRLSIWWIIAVITFHSIEDRIVKHIFDPYLEATIDDVTGQIITPAPLKKYSKKPIEPTEAEILANPRSRSARLRAFQKMY